MNPKKDVMVQHNVELFSGKRLWLSIKLCLLLLLIPWGVHLYQWWVDPGIIAYGLRPWNYHGLVGIFTMPFLHSGFGHLLSNSIPLFVMGSGLFFYYKESAWRILFWMLILTGSWLWLIGQPGSNHVGASGLVYSLAAFHFMGGLIRRNRNLTAFALLVIFLYGGLIWSVFPDFFPDRKISWEGHLSGLLSGLVLALVFRKHGPLPDPVLLDDDEDVEDDENNKQEENTDQDGEEKKSDSASPPGAEGGGSTNSTSGHPYQYHAT